MMRRKKRASLGAGTEKVLVFLLFYETAVVLLGMYNGYNEAHQIAALQRSETLLMNAVSDLTRETERLQREIDGIEKSPSYALRILRDKFHQTAEGEKIIFFAD